jgi:hypothetical protein
MLDERTDAAFLRVHLTGPPSKSSVRATIFCGSKPRSLVTKNFSSALLCAEPRLLGLQRLA